MYYLVSALLIVFGCTARADTFIPASSPSVWSVGRTRIDPNGTLSFDWESTQFYVNILGGTYAKMHMKASGGIKGLFLIQIDGFEQSQIWIDGSLNGEVQEFLIADQVGAEIPRQIRVISVLEPAFEGASPTAFFTFFGFSTDGKPATAGPARSRRIELVGDSISAGYGSRGYQGAPGGCPVNGWTSGNPYTYNWFIAENFQADIIPIAWSGKGMYQNCCDNGEKMPSYYLQTLGGGSYTQDWDFSRYKPDLIIINLGTNDFGHDSGPEWEAQFVSTYVDFVKNATTRYKNPALPIFVAQGPMNCGTPLRNCLDKIVSEINANNGNAVFLNLCGPPNDGCGGHPGVEGHKQMAAMAIPVIGTKMNWK